MRVVDANVLLYATNSSVPHHSAAKTWLDKGLSGQDTIGFCWVSLLAFVRLVTKVGLFPEPLSVTEASDQVINWLAAPGAVLVHPGPNHAEQLARLLGAVGTGGNLVNDAHLAAIALEQRAEVVTYDNDFDRFPGVRWRRPDDLI